MKKPDLFDAIFFSGVGFASSGFGLQQMEHGLIFFGLCLIYIGIARGN